MTWPATTRYELRSAPGGLGLVQDLLNTRPRVISSEADLLSTVRSAQDWASTALRAWGEHAEVSLHVIRVTSHDLAPLRDLRTQLSASLITRDQSDSASESLDGHDLATVNLTARWTADGTVKLVPAGSGWMPVAAAVLIEISVAQENGTWRRLKTCRNEICPGAFFDRSHNNSGVWHDVRTCGNRSNVNAFRERRRRLKGLSNELPAASPRRSPGGRRTR